MDAWAARLREAELIRFGAIAVYVVHDLAALAIDPRALGIRVVVSGHSHKPLVVERHGVLYVNPGSAGPRRFHLPICAGGAHHRWKRRVGSHSRAGHGLTSTATPTQGGTMRHWIRGVVLIAFGLTTACQGGDALVQTIAELQAVKQAVVRATGHSDVQVKLAGAGGLSVSLINSPLMALPAEKRNAKAWTSHASRSTAIRGAPRCSR